jgi:hypothetical protein
MSKKANLKDGPFISAKEFEVKLRELFEEDYIIIQGQFEAIQTLEMQIYPPGTKKNKNFVGFLLPSYPPYPLFLGKKTKALKKLLLHLNPKTKGHFKELFGLTIFLIEEFRAIAKATFIEERARQENIHHIITKLKSKITGLEVV